MRERNKPNSDAVKIQTGDINQACTRYSLGKASMRRVAEDANAVVRIGKRYLINFVKVDAYMNAISQ